MKFSLESAGENYHEDQHALMLRMLRAKILSKILVFIYYDEKESSL